MLVRVVEVACRMLIAIVDTRSLPALNEPLRDKQVTFLERLQQVVEVACRLWIALVSTPRLPTRDEPP